MKPLTKQTILIPDKNGELVILSMGNEQPQTFYDEKELFVFTEEQLKEFIGEVFDKARETKLSLPISKSNPLPKVMNSYSKEELIKQLLI